MDSVGFKAPRQTAPQTMTDGSDASYEPFSGATAQLANPVDDAIARTRKAVFARHGHDPDIP